MVRIIVLLVIFWQPAVWSVGELVEATPRWVSLSNPRSRAKRDL